MASKTSIQFPIFAPLNPTPHRPATEVRFSRWNNANAQKFVRQERTQKEIEDELRLVKRFNSADNIANSHENATKTAGDNFRSIGTPSAPSRPSIPGKSSKYSKSPRYTRTVHPAFRRAPEGVNVPAEGKEADAAVKLSDDGVSYVLPHAPFAFQYSYTETPKVKPLKLREAPVAPFGPSTMPRPWTGRKPLPAGKKKVEFDSFRLPPPHKKGVKPVQAPGPFLAGSGPKYAMSREEILGEPLTKEEIDALVKGCMKSTRQLNMGRDGLTHNMLDNIHALWKRRRVCKIKCKGVCTVDIENVRQQLEEKSGGKVIHHTGGVIYLFRGRNYNYRTRPRFPLMLWRPISPVYPRLVKRVPEGLTLEEASEMRKKGRELIPICKLGKNGVYVNLVKNVREAFEACELARIDCQGMNGSDYRKIGGKLRDLVPCVLISFEREHILMWRGKEWKSSFPQLLDNSEAKTDGAIPLDSTLAGEVAQASIVPESEECASLETLNSSISLVHDEDDEARSKYASDDDHVTESNEMPSLVYGSVSNTEYIDESESPSLAVTDHIQDEIEVLAETDGSSEILHTVSDKDVSVESDITTESISMTEPEDEENLSLVTLSSRNELPGSCPWTEKVLGLWEEAIESRTAVLLEDVSTLNSDAVYKEAVALAKSAPPGPVFRHRHKRPDVQKTETTKPGDREAKEVEIVIEKGRIERKSSTKKRTRGLREDYLDVVPKGTLGVDELAKLLA